MGAMVPREFALVGRGVFVPFSESMDKPVSLQTAVATGLFHWGLLAVAQAENSGFFDLAWLPLMQRQNGIAAILVAGIAFVSMRARWSSWLFFAGYAAMTIFVAVTPAYFQSFGDHPRLSLGEGGMTALLPRLLSSASAAVAAAWWKLALNAVLALSVLVWVWKKLFGTHPTHEKRLPSAVRRGLSLLPGMAIVAGVFPIPQPVKNAATHPLFPLLQEALMPRVSAGLSAKVGDDAPVDARASSAPGLADAVMKIRAVSPKPNIVFIVLESVGSRHLLGNLANTPNIAALARSAVAFENVYAVYPSTARNHLAINTGGFQLTGEGMIEAFQREFTGPLMARGFAAAGYATALFSSERLDVEGMDQFERRAGWGTLYDFGRDVKNHLSANILNSWCAKEEFTMTQIEPWLETHRTAPFLLSYMNGATHHPYSVPRGFPEPNGRADDAARFRNALHYTDAVIGQLIAMLKARGLFENTVIAITGDHGEAFGEHPGNFAHKNAIYEENIRTFLLLSHPALGTSIASNRIASSGDIYATLAALAGFEAKTPGIALTTRDFPARAVFFTKGAFPEQWGLRDGKWKFIQTIRERQSELYDLTTDPGEHTNLAGSNAALVAKFSDQCERWYLRTHTACAARFSGSAAPQIEATPGAK